MTAVALPPTDLELTRPVPASTDRREPPPELISAYAAVDAYQPVFGFEGSFRQRNVSRGCIDRCNYLSAEFGDDVRNLKILDVGSSMGYLTLYFASLGARTSGFDYNEDNIRFCRTLAGIHGLQTDFTFGTFGLDYCRELRKGQYDVAFLFSVLHHVVHLHGLEKTQQMMEELLDKVGTLYVELALKSENVPFPWKGSLPEDELEIFRNRPELEIVRLADFPALGDSTIRPLYRVRRRTPVANGIHHQDARRLRSQIKTGATADRSYLVGAELFTKTFAFRESRDTYHRYLTEVEAMRRLDGRPHFLPLLRASVEEATGSITMPRIHGATLIDAMKAGARLDIDSLGWQIATVLASFHERGLYWNDFRAHNLLLSNDRVTAIDFEVSAPIEIEHTLHLFAWMLCDLQHGRSLTHERNVFAAGGMGVPRPPFALTEYPASVRPLAELAVSSRNVAQFSEEFGKLATV